MAAGGLGVIPEVTSIPGVIPSAQMREGLAGQTVLLAFSRGKDSLAAWLALREAGCTVIPYHLYLVPGLAFVDQSLAYYAGWFGCPILNLPHPSLYRWLANLVYQSPERCQVIERAGIVVPTYADVNDLVREYLGLPAGTWVCDGVRSADSPNRRMGLSAGGPVNHRARTLKVVWDWRKAHVMAAIGRAGVDLPPDYAWFGRSFDGIDRRFLAPLDEHAPGDYDRILSWFPLAGLDIRRGPVTAATSAAGPRQGFAERARREAERFRLATDSEFWVAFCFRTRAAAARFQARAGMPGTMLGTGTVQRRLEVTRGRVRRAVSARDVLDGVACTGDLAGDAAAELAAIHAALTAPPDPAPGSVLDSPHWVAAWWPSRAAKNEFLADSGLDVLGDKYLDGHQAASVLGVSLR